MVNQIPIVIFRLDNQLYALPNTAVKRILQALEIVEVPNMPKTMLGVINFEGEIITVNNIRDQLGLPYRPLSVKDYIVIAQNTSGLYGFVVNDVDFGTVSPKDVTKKENMNIIYNAPQGLIYLMEEEHLIQQHPWKKFHPLQESMGPDNGFNKRE